MESRIPGWFGLERTLKTMGRDTLLLNILHIFFYISAQIISSAESFPWKRIIWRYLLCLTCLGGAFPPVSGVLYQCQQELEGSPSARNRQENFKNMEGNFSVIWSSLIRIFYRCCKCFPQSTSCSLLCCGCRNSHRTNFGFLTRGVDFILLCTVMHPKQSQTSLRVFFRLCF